MMRLPTWQGCQEALEYLQIGNETSVKELEATNLGEVRQLDLGRRQKPTHQLPLPLTHP